ncbi:cytochrome c oxidase subunit 7C, mitochondrial-like [Hylaeus volcanicus]|uniref:cytochrome c oxidase subunit 7C, mitochondrial-like n=1 Tax=Hylaeus volcanicus TaxID=313075 RepID=UPI0023B80236|nr:cytochrome c oxidase subunit 7C, mitochondrial-like [Hylaeus volcanicus]
MISQHVRRFVTSAVRRSGHDPEGFPGANLPFSVENRYKLTALFTVFFGSGLALPYLILRHQLLK